MHHYLQKQVQLRCWNEQFFNRFQPLFQQERDDDGNDEPNWFRYWKRDGAVPNMAVAKYDASSTDYGYMTGGGELYLTRILPASITTTQSLLIHPLGMSGWWPKCEGH